MTLFVEAQKEYLRVSVGAEEVFYAEPRIPYSSVGGRGIRGSYMENTIETRHGAVSLLAPWEDIAKHLKAKVWRCRGYSLSPIRLEL